VLPTRTPFYNRDARLDTQNNPRGLPVTSVFDIKYILAEILRCPHNEVKISQWRQLFTTHRVWYEFNIFSTSDYKKRWSYLYITLSTEYWNCKAGFWFPNLNVGCATYTSILVECWALNFQECVIMLNVESLSWIINLVCWNGKLKVGWYTLILAAQVELLLLILRCPCFVCLRGSSAGRSGGGARKGSRACNCVCGIWIYALKFFDAKCWFAEMTLLMTSLPLARVFRCLLHSRSFPLRADWRKSDSSVDRDPQGIWRWNSNSRDVFASSPSFCCPAARAPGLLAPRILLCHLQ